MADKLAMFNKALRAIGDLRLASLTEDVEARYVLDDAWEGCMCFVFTEGLWNFATETQVIYADPGQPPIPGFGFTFDKPVGWIRTITISPTSLFDVEANYRDEGNRIYANYDELYIRFISKAKAADDQVPNWPISFADAVAMYLAKECAERLSGSGEKAGALANLYKEAIASAKNKDAMDQSKMIMRPGNWVRAMRGSSQVRDRGPLSGY
jgi:hypothetical protein